MKDGYVFDLSYIVEFGEKGVLVLFLDSLEVEYFGIMFSDSLIEEEIRYVF